MAKLESISYSSSEIRGARLLVPPHTCSGALLRTENDLRHHVLISAKCVIHDRNSGNLQVIQRKSLSVEPVEPRFVDAARAPARRRVAEVLEGATVLR